MNAAARALLGPEIYRGYAYSYPHKTAHRALSPPVDLAGLWAGQERGALSLYLHVPFCRRRCGYCNLFSLDGAEADLVAAYLKALRRQAVRVRQCLGQAAFARIAIGGGTPSDLGEAQLAELLAVAAEVMGARPEEAPTSIEVSPASLTPGTLQLLRRRGVERVSVGVQSFLPAECEALGRPQPLGAPRRACRLVREAGFGTLNVDLIYGLPGQTLESVAASLREALGFGPEEIFLYPLYVRPLTAIFGRPQADEAFRLAAYRLGRAMLLDRGYTQVSMRMFRRTNAPPVAAPVYCCQRDGMVALGCGPRSYTAALHYSWPYAVGRSEVAGILRAYVAADDAAFARADYGIALDGEDQRRRFVIQSILQCVGLDTRAYRERFGNEAAADLPQLSRLIEAGLATAAGERLRLTAEGLERSDAIGPWLYSATVRRLMEEFLWR